MISYDKLIYLSVLITFLAPSLVCSLEANGDSLPLLPLLSWAAKDRKLDKTTEKLNETAFLECILDPESVEGWLACMIAKDEDSCKTVLAKVIERPECGANQLNFKKVFKKIRRKYKWKISGLPDKVYGLSTLVFWALQFSMEKPTITLPMPDIEHHELLAFIFKYKDELWKLIRKGREKEDYGENVAKFFYEHADEIDWLGRKQLSEDDEEEDALEDEQDEVDRAEELRMLKELAHKSIREVDKDFLTKLKQLMRLLVHKHHLHGKKCKFFGICDPFHNKIKSDF
ncbi:uncharacterized protein LOC141849326 [Brevipalpus obovatus]|uniref:uncharacterized protein LOC141849326 n=1 Tax=Brevipalpus obovatus TaxID=246614 RepID=UPI003D9E1B13